MTGSPLVSIVTPTLNQGQFIEATIRSVREQTYQHFEHIVVDGGSADGTLDILRLNEGTYPMRWISEPDRGMYDAINKGMAMANGDILAYLNSDDLYFPWTLEAVVEAFEQHPDADVVYGDAMGISPTGRLDLRFQPPHRYGFLLHASSYVQPAVFWRRAVAERVGRFDASMRLAGDLDFLLRIGRAGRFVRLDEMLAIERDHEVNLRSQQWDHLIAESSVSRAAVQAMSPGRHRVLRSLERLRAWTSRRGLWLAFALEARRSARGAPKRWRRFLGAGPVRLHAARLVMGQLPWLGKRFVAGAISPAVDWTRPPGARATSVAADGGPAAGLEHPA
jgi:glycosyltransferase involved in cell wall biosynthesis